MEQKTFKEQLEAIKPFIVKMACKGKKPSGKGKGGGKTKISKEASTENK